MEYLGRELNQLSVNDNFNFHPRCRKLNSVHICFADDLLMYCRADLISVKFLNEAFIIFSKALGLQANLEKSSLYITGVADHTKEELLKELGYAAVSWETICKPHATGGLNIMDLCLWNRTAILKQLRNIARSKECLWIPWVHTYFIRRQRIEIVQIPKSASWVVRKILAARNWILQGQVSHDLKFIVWLAIHKRLATVDKLVKFGIQIPRECAYCGLTDETFSHLYFDCQITKDLVIQDWETKVRWVCLMAKKKLGLAEIECSVFGMLVYIIWRELNRIRFQHGKVKDENVLREIVMHMHIKGQTRATWQCALQQLHVYP
ncbi:hypothetical protein R3W88_031618 [Solanum pinnatisectum]|uniref:Reverse transcriptase zinc-binding domain-containing protein n=1 Tax=Solanum pinnatisectum TaxID=50273 RepID=A0AAV9LLW9_9SOLN|nr:hypothetical protein R3W88_031618 [Solanum pinnatisectum]